MMKAPIMFAFGNSIIVNYFPFQNSTVMARAQNFHNVDYLLIHGTADGEVFEKLVPILRENHFVKETLSISLFL